MKQERKELIVMVLVTVFMIAVAISSCESIDAYKSEQYFPIRVGSGIR
jgi:hypothetical protein